MNIKNLIPLLLVILFSNYAWQPANAETFNEPVKLIENFMSYQSIEEAKQYCYSLGFQWIIVEDSRLPERDRRPRFDIFVVKVDGYRHLVQFGTLRLEFYNDRLADLRFYPDDYEAYLKILQEKENIDLTNTQEKIFTNVRIWRYEKWDKSYVGWADLRLEQEEFEWIKKYS